MTGGVKATCRDVLDPAGWITPPQLLRVHRGHRIVLPSFPSLHRLETEVAVVRVLGADATETK